MGYEPAAPCRRAKAFGAQFSNGVKTMVQAHIVYSGVVQGVGFRFTTQRKAKELHLTGWVRNLSDGRVEILAEGPKKTIQQLIENLDEHFGQYIKSKQISFSNYQGVFSDFLISLTH
jgi:acylphosphatase